MEAFTDKRENQDIHITRSPKRLLSTSKNIMNESNKRIDLLNIGEKEEKTM